ALVDSCAVYMQGRIDPAGRLLPLGVTPAGAGLDSAGQRSYFVAGHESSGQNVIHSALNDNSDSAHRFSMNVYIGGTGAGSVAPSSGAANGRTKVTLNWYNFSGGHGPRHPQIMVTELGTHPSVSAKIAKGDVTGMPGFDSVGPQVGNLQHGI